jgi:predicted O-methyltransferase YrrM
VAERIDLRIGPAIETLQALPAEPRIDIAFIDADKSSYPAYYEEIVRRLRRGGLVVLDNVFLGGRGSRPGLPGGTLQGDTPPERSDHRGRADGLGDAAAARRHHYRPQTITTRIHQPRTSSRRSQIVCNPAAPP